MEGKQKITPLSIGSETLKKAGSIWTFALFGLTCPSAIPDKPQGPCGIGGLDVPRFPGVGRQQQSEGRRKGFQAYTTQCAGLSPKRVSQLLRNFPLTALAVCSKCKGQG